MYNFIAYNPVKLHFGKNVVKDLGAAAAALGKKALLVYGSGSVLRNGSYNDTVEQLRSNDIDKVEYNGIKPNPRVEEVMAAAAAGRESEVDMVVAVGGFPVALTANVDAAKEKIAKKLAMYGMLPSYRAMMEREGAEGPQDIAMLGDEKSLRAQIERLRAIGVTDFNAAVLNVEQGAFERTVEFLAAL